MKKKLIRLTESDLHRIVKESVNRILNEVEYGGESLHGNNAEDWGAVHRVRSARGWRDQDERDIHNNLEKARSAEREWNIGRRDQENGIELTNSDGLSGAEQIMKRSPYFKGYHQKGKRMAQNLGLGDYADD